MVGEFRLNFAKSDAKFMFTCIHISSVHTVTDNSNDMKGNVTSTANSLYALPEMIK